MNCHAGLQINLWQTGCESIRRETTSVWRNSETVNLQRGDMDQEAGKEDTATTGPVWINLAPSPAVWPDELHKEGSLGHF